MVKISFEAGKKDLIWIGLFVILLGVGAVYAYGSGNPQVMGHNVKEIQLPACGEGKFLVKTADSWGCGTPAVPASTTAINYAYGGRYTMAGSSCIEKNKHTNACACPSGFSRDVMNVDYASIDGYGASSISVNFCYDIK